VAWLGVLGGLAFSAPAAAQDSAVPQIIRVRTPNAYISGLIAEGAERSPTFRDLMTRLDRTRWFVLIQRGQCPDARAIGCLLHSVLRFEGSPYLRIVIDDRRLRPRDLQIEVIAHELCHALEAAESPEVTDTASLVALFRRIGRTNFESSQMTTYETAAALETGQRVATELHR
jgi:hypothetical protein